MYTYTFVPTLLLLLMNSGSIYHCVAGKLSPTDTITWGGDNSRQGYFTTHNFDPSVVGSNSFVRLFKAELPGKYNDWAEQIFSQPLVYTLDDDTQYVFVATTQNNVYKINARTGAIIMKRALHIPFLTSDLNGCIDINPTIGVTSTGVIDPATDTWYLTAKTYLDQSDKVKGRGNARYHIHALDVNTLLERKNFPIDLEGTLNRNSNAGNRMFQAGAAHQRPGLLHHGSYIYAGFASHCVQYNFTGWIMGWHALNGQIVAAFATEGGPEPNKVPGGGVWMSGGGIASDNRGSMFFATGNGYASQLKDISIPGRQPPTALEEAAVHLSIHEDGSLSVVDFFMPWEKVQLDGADKDLGTSPLQLLDPTVYHCSMVSRIGIVTGKSGKTYILDLDNLGGYQNGPNHSDAVVQVIQNENSVYAGAGVFPPKKLIYINVTGYTTHVFRMSCNKNGMPVFTAYGDTVERNAYILGTGHGTTTSIFGQSNTGLLWISDVQGDHLRIYDALPINRKLKLVKTFKAPGSTKFGRPVFGDGIVYIGTTHGTLYAFGSQRRNTPLNCFSPIEFASTIIGSVSEEIVITCTALVDVDVNSLTMPSLDFVPHNLPSVPINLKQGQSFSMPATFAPQSAGSITGEVVLDVSCSTANYTGSVVIALSGKGRSIAPLLSIVPGTVRFESVIIGEQVGGITSSVLFENRGDSELKIAWTKYTQHTASGDVLEPIHTRLGPCIGPFTLMNLPTTIPGRSQVAVAISFNPSRSGRFAVFATVFSNGGTYTFDIVGNANGHPVALLEYQSSDDSNRWSLFSPRSRIRFGNVTENQSKTIRLRLTNAGGSLAGPLSVTVSKPPFGVAGLIQAKNNVDIAEGTSLSAGESATAELFCAVPRAQVNTPSYRGIAHWTMNTNDPKAGKIVIQFSCTAVAEQVGPLDVHQQAFYRYSGCYEDANPRRLLPKQVYTSRENTNEKCITACAVAGYQYAGTEYEVECWCGHDSPKANARLERDCNFGCAGNNLTTCGGKGFDARGTYLSIFEDPQAGNDSSQTSTTGSGSIPAMAGLVYPANVGPYILHGCYAEITDGRALGSAAVANDNMTLEKCAKRMVAYDYFGLEYGRECYGGRVVADTATTVSLEECDMPCAGNVSEACGAGKRLLVYRLPR